VVIGSDANEGKAVPEVGNPRKWLVSEQSSQSRTNRGSGITTYLHELTLEEYESHKPERLVLPGLSLKPYMSTRKPLVTTARCGSTQR